MTVQTNTIRAILRKHAADDDSALRATSVDEEFKGLRVFQEALAALDIESELLERASYSSKAKTPYLQLTVVDPSANDEENDEDEEYEVILLDLEFVEQQLLISQSRDHEGVLVESAEQVANILQALEARWIENLKEEKKRSKVRDLKYRSIETQIDAMAQRLQFDYCVTESSMKAVVEIRLDDAYALTVNIPMNRIQACVDELETLIRSVRELYRQKARIKVGQTSRYTSFKSWKKA